MLSYPATLGLTIQRIRYRLTNTETPRVAVVAEEHYHRHKNGTLIQSGFNFYDHAPQMAYVEIQRAELYCSLPRNVIHDLIHGSNLSNAARMHALN